MSHKIFETPIQIRFAHCDPAGIVFHPQYFTIFNGVIEDFFREVVNVPFMELVRHGIGMPVVGIRCDFVHPSRPGDSCVAKLWIERMGVSSIRFGMTLECADQVRLRMAETVVCVSKQEGMSAQPIPEQLREKMQPYVMDETNTPLALRA
ncbi:MAG: acyl-CoA thioesterase [Duodenibacillus sp.]|jgi:4-hydroxybenzoyl-CoA thioesterase|nr:acyl-CoA thioesterase [Duodenibacillus sp.]